MNKIEAIKASIEHWQRMIAWAKEQPYGQEPDSEKMKRAIGEKWFTADCSLCKVFKSHYNGDCRPCPLHDSRQYHWVCCNEWVDVNNSETWGGWVTEAEHLLWKLKVVLAESQNELCGAGI